MDCGIVHVLCSEGCSVELEAFMCAFEIAKIFGVLEGLPDKI